MREGLGSRKLGVPTRLRSLKGRMGQLVRRQFLRAAKPCESLLGTAAARKKLALGRAVRYTRPGKYSTDRRRQGSCVSICWVKGTGVAQDPGRSKIRDGA